FALARLLGRRFVIRMVGEQRYSRYSSRFTGRFSLGLFLLFLLPFSPGDALCFLAGLSPLPLRIYLALLLLGRLPGTIVGALMGGAGGYLMGRHGGAPVLQTRLVRRAVRPEHLDRAHRFL